MNYDVAGGPIHFSLTKRITEEAVRVLSPAALSFVATLHNEFECRRRELLDKRRQKQSGYHHGLRPSRLLETAPIRIADWQTIPPPKNMSVGRVELFGSADLQSLHTGWMSGADAYVADLDNYTAPVWTNLLSAQVNLRDLVTSDKSGHRKALILQPRSLHRCEQHMQIAGAAVSASLFDTGIYLFNNAAALLATGSRPHLYLPKLESHLEARLWAEIFEYVQTRLRLPENSILATITIETIGAALEMDEILFELKNHAVGLSCGYSHFLYDGLKKFASQPSFLLPARSSFKPDPESLQAFDNLLIATCHRRGAQAVGRVSCAIPNIDNDSASAQTFATLYADKERERRSGFDGTGIANRLLLEGTKAAFQHRESRGKDWLVQSAFKNHNADVLLDPPVASVSPASLRKNIRLAVVYLEAWMRGSGYVPIAGQIIDAETAETCCAQLAHWTRHAIRLNDGRPISKELIVSWATQELSDLFEELHDRPEQRDIVFELFHRLVFSSNAEARRQTLDNAAQSVLADPIAA